MVSQSVQQRGQKTTSSTKRSTLAGWLLLAVSAVGALTTSTGCGQGNAAPAVCSTNSDWIQGDQGSPLMHPGDACIACHTSNGGPNFILGGTVMAATNDDTDCNGVQGATVEIKGADGTVITLTTNAAGNFYQESMAGLSTPYTAKIIQGGKERAMMASQTTGDCNSCHTAAGANGAPGRLLLPL
jgi:mono/diheme cytochrome c family protein